MRRRQILLDDETDRILADMAAPYSGNRSKAVREAIRAHQVVEEYLDQIEQLHGPALRRQKERSEKEFRNGRYSSWQAIKQRNRL